MPIKFEIEISDEEIESLAIESGWTAETVIVSSDIKTDTPDGVETVDVAITDSKGRSQSVQAHNLAFLKTRVEDIYKGGVKTGRKQLAFVFQFGTSTIKTYSKMLEEAYKKGELTRGDIVPFKADTCKPTHVPAKNGEPSYFFWEGATLEAGSDVMQDAREFTERRDAKFATLSAEGQAKVLETRATSEADAFLAEFG